jgi:hypothetical protein
MMKKIVQEHVKIAFTLAELALDLNIMNVLNVKTKEEPLN